MSRSTWTTQRAASRPTSPRTNLGIAAALAGCTWLAGCSGSSSKNTTASNGDAAANSNAWFENVVANSGITFIHDNGHTDRYLMPENVPGGAALFDMDNDGDLDLYLVQSGNPVDPSANTAGNMLYENLGDWHFRDVTARSGTGDRGFGQGAACADYDNDGDVDLYVTNLGTNVLYRNNGDGTFTDVTATAGVGHPGWSTSAVWFDYDRDDDLDLYVCTYINWALDIEQDCFNKMGGNDYCAPRNYNSPGLDALYRNNGDGT
ncbi:MAG: VCBS repeat-containing protein, partial [Phycisphaerales bacterium]|nr:VCBS repeat-containing protein [Phycisphaerales bacterium]